MGGGGFNTNGALGGAAGGASLGSQVMPGWGTAIGGLAGGLLGGFGKGGGQKPPNYQALAQQQNNYQTPWGSLQNGTFTMNPVAGQALGNLQNNLVGASQMDPAQARNQAIQGNLAYGQQLLAPQFQMQNEGLKSSDANTGASPQQQLLESTLLGNQQGGMLGGVLNNALNQGNATQYAQMAQANLPFQQYGELINSSLQRPSQPNLLGAGALQNQQNIQQQNAQQAGKTGLFNSLGGSGLFRPKGGGGGVGPIPQSQVPQMIP